MALPFAGAWSTQRLLDWVSSRHPRGPVHQTVWLPPKRGLPHPKPRSPLQRRCGHVRERSTNDPQPTWSLLQNASVSTPARLASAHPAVSLANKERVGRPWCSRVLVRCAFGGCEVLMLVSSYLPCCYSGHVCRAAGSAARASSVHLSRVQGGGPKGPRPRA